MTNLDTSEKLLYIETEANLKKITDHACLVAFDWLPKQTPVWISRTLISTKSDDLIARIQCQENIQWMFEGYPISLSIVDWKYRELANEK